MKVYTKLVLDIDGKILEENSYQYTGEVTRLGGGGGTPKNQTTTQKSEPWAGTVPFLLGGNFGSLSPGQRSYGGYSNVSNTPNIWSGGGMGYGGPGHAGGGVNAGYGSAMGPSGQTGNLGAATASGAAVGGSGGGPTWFDRQWLAQRDGISAQPQQIYSPPSPSFSAGGGSQIVGILPEAERLYREGPSMVTPFSGETEEALQLQADRARSGSDLVRSAQDQNLATTRGDYLYGGPAFNAALDAATRRILPQVNSMFSRAGRYGSGLAQTAQTQALSDSFAGLYDSERQRQLAAVQQAPMLANQDYADILQLQSVGEQRENLMKEYQMEPYNRLNQYASMIYPLTGAGGTTTSSQPLYRNRTAGAAGGALAGAQMGSMFGPWGAAIGAIGGGLLGAR